MRRQTQMIGSILPLLATTLALADGGWETQTIDLDTGWNLVWLEVEPSATANDAGSVFGPDATSVCGFIAGRGLGDRGAWRCFHANEPAFLSTLGEIQGDRGYFVLSAADVSIDITGRPVRRNRPIAGETPALFGAAGESFSAPAFFDFFTIGDAINRITEINTFDAFGDDFETLLANASIDAGTAYWLTTDIDQDYAGPLRLKTSAGGLQFGKNHYLLDLSIEVPRDSIERTVTVDVLDSAAPPLGEPTDASAGDTTWLQYKDEFGAWQTFPMAVTIPAGETTAVILLRADRKGRAPACVDPDNALYQALIQVTDDAGNREVIGAGMEVLDSIEGTWMGDVTLHTVSLNSGLTPPPANADSAEPMHFGLLLEIPAPGAGAGPARILDRVCLPVDATYNVDGTVDTYDRFTAFRSVMFPDVVVLDANYDGIHDLAADHPLNPYRHRYNPEHVSGYAVTRTIDIEITEDDPATPNLFLGDLLSERAGNNVLVGTYTETITGLSAETIVVSGTLRLVRLSEDTGLRECPE